MWFMVDLLFVLLFLVSLFVIFWCLWSGLKGFLVMRENSSGFECGFDSKDGGGRVPFSLRFFMIIMLFMVFDLEMCYILKIPYLSFDYFFKSLFVFCFFIIILLLGTLEEWRRGMFYWKNV